MFKSLISNGDFKYSCLQGSRFWGIGAIRASKRRSAKRLSLARSLDDLDVSSFSFLTLYAMNLKHGKCFFILMLGCSSVLPILVGLYVQK